MVCKLELTCTGRPPAISDDDIDVEFPTDIDEDVHDLETLQQAAKKTTDCPASPPTTLTPFVHLMRLRRIESKIEHITYRVDRHSETTPAVLQAFLDELAAWKKAIPLEYHSQTGLKNDSDYAIGIDNFVRIAEPTLKSFALSLIILDDTILQGHSSVDLPTALEIQSQSLLPQDLC